MQVKEVKLTQIKNAAENYRLGESEKDVSALMASIKKTGLLNPITVQKVGSGYKLLAGFRRFRAFKKLKMDSIPVNIIDKSKGSIIINLVENMQRENTTSYEIGRGIHDAMKKDKLNVKEVAVLLGATPNVVNTYLNLFKNTPVEFRDKVRSFSTGASQLTKKGSISNATASSIINLRKRGIIDLTETKQMFKMAAKDPNFNSKKIRTLDKQTVMKTGAVKSVKTMKHITVSFKMTAAALRKLGTKPHDKIRNAVAEKYNIKVAN